MNFDYAIHSFSVLLLSSLGVMLLWSVGFAVYLNRIHSHGWASTRRLARTLPPVAVVALILCALFWEDALVPHWFLAQVGRPSAQMALGGDYLMGDRLLAKNPTKGRAWITRAARSGLTEAQIVLAGMDLEGKGSRPDPLAALHWARLAAGKGLTDAQLLTGEILLLHPELAQSGEKAQVYFDAAIPSLLSQAKTGNAQAQFSLGMLKIRGHGLPLDLEGGLALLLRAEKRGIPPHQALQIAMLRTTLPPEVLQRAERASQSPELP